MTALLRQIMRPDGSTVGLAIVAVVMILACVRVEGIQDRARRLRQRDHCERIEIYHLEDAPTRPRNVIVAVEARCDRPDECHKRLRCRGLRRRR